MRVNKLTLLYLSSCLLCVVGRHFQTMRGVGTFHFVFSKKLNRCIIMTVKSLIRDSERIPYVLLQKIESVVYSRLLWRIQVVYLTQMKLRADGRAGGKKRRNICVRILDYGRARRLIFAYLYIHCVREC